MAAQLVQLASRSRASNATLRPNEVESAIQLRKDFGRVAQQFPLDKSIEITRPSVQQLLLDQTVSQRAVLTGPPGSGKSWALTEFADNLKTSGYIVARHYCYLEPGDPQVQRRVTTDVLFANLIYDLIHTQPALRKLHQPIYSAGPRELEDLLTKGVEAGLIDKAVLIVDGVDHVSRVFAEARDLRLEDVDVVEELSAIKLPEGVSLIIGSQPGIHLDPLSEIATSIPMPDWRADEVAALAIKLGIVSALERSGLASALDDFLEQLYVRSEGNPLYATFLCRQILAGLTAGRAFDPVEFLRDAPVIEGQISRYYEYLFSHLERGSTSGVIAELLGVIDFGLTEKDIQSIYPQFAHRVPAAVSFLSPILTQVSAQSGMRIYHESFRRYVTERLRKHGGSVTEVIAPVIEWLNARGFYQDAKAYRFLLPSLRRAGRNREALQLAEARFVSSSVHAGHSRRAIEENLKLATYIAAAELDWATLARCAELHRSCYTCFEEKLLDVESFGRTYAAIFGATALNERLLFDGQPTFPAHEGLLFCSLCDDAGEVPPWSQYLDLHAEGDKRRSRESRGASETDWETLAVAEVHGALRLEGVDPVFHRLVSYLERLPSPPVKYLRLILRRMIQFGGADVLFRVLDEARMSDQAAAIVMIELANALAAESEAEAAQEVATEAVRRSDSVELIAEGLTLGADLGEVAKRLPDLSIIDIAVRNDSYIAENNQLKLWIEGIRIAGSVNPHAIEPEMERIQGEGWYRAWLRFIVTLSQAEAQAKNDLTGSELSIGAAIRELAADTRPFVGKPRACDLYWVHSLVHETISRALRLLRSLEAWQEALKHLAEISRGTTTYLQGSPSGPLQPEHFIETLLPFAKNPVLEDCVIDAIKHQLSLTIEHGEFYETHAAQEMLLARVLADAGRVEEAQSLWRSASVNLCAYGYRKDTTIYELIESTPALARVDNEKGRNALSAVQPLVNAVVQHTDGKETKHAPIYWIGALSKVDPVGGAFVLARTLVQYGGTVDWRQEDAVSEVCDAVRHSGDPPLVAYIEATLPFAGSVKAVQRRLIAVERLLENDTLSGEHALRLLAAQVHGDPEKFSPMAYKELETVGRKYGISLPSANRDIGSEEEEEKESYTSEIDPLDAFRDTPAFPYDAAPLEIMAIIRSSRGLLRGDGANQDRVINALGYRLAELIDRGAEEESLRIMRFFARESYFPSGATPLADLAAGLERCGHPRAASVALALAYARSRGGYGWLALGDSEHMPWMSRARRLSNKDAFSTLADEIAHLLNNQRYIMGVTRHLVEVCASQGEPTVAFDTWYAAFEVIRHRLPGNENDISTFHTYSPGLVPQWSLDEALVALLLARVSHPEFMRKITALSGVSAAVSANSSLVIDPIVQFLRIDTPITSALIVLHAMVEAERDPYPVTVAAREELLGLYRSDVFGLRVLAEILLERAGIHPEEVRRENRTLLNSPTLPEWKEERILSIDEGGRVDDLGRIWPDFPSLVARRYDDASEKSKTRKELSRYRHNAAMSRVRENLPPTELLFWEEELFECTFHEVLDGIDSYLRESDEWSSSLITEIGVRVLPRVYTHIAHWHSRTPRPPLLLPSEQQGTVEAVSPIQEIEEYAGWFRCGYFERELLMSEENWRSCTGTVTVMEGVQFPQEVGVPDTSKMPLAEGDSDAWWAFEESATPLIDFVGSVAEIDFVVDWLGKLPILILRPSLAGHFKLRAPESWQNQLVLTDAGGLEAVVFRCWRVRPVGASISEENPRLEGCDLLIRADIFTQLQQSSLNPPLTVRLVHHSQE